jgi:hypothetical protein
MVSNYDAHAVSRVARQLQQLGHDSLKAGAIAEAAAADALGHCELMDREVARVMEVLRQFQM